VPVRAENAASLWKVLQQPDLRTYQDLPSVGAAVFADMVAKRPKHLHPSATGRFEWLIYVAGVRKPVGWVSLRIAERDAGRGEIGYSVIREYRSRGIASEAVRALLGEAFDSARLASVNAYCVPDNEPSRRLLERIGFRCEGTLPHGATVSGHPVDVLMHSIEREQWRQSGNSMVMPASGYPA
jgi:RimJ/RimL family protein N-acetyltransferase